MPAQEGFAHMPHEQPVSADRHDRFAASVPMMRPADPSEVAKLALFLACDDSSYMTGSELFVDGGAAQV